MHLVAYLGYRLALIQTVSRINDSIYIIYKDTLIFSYSNLQLINKFTNT